MSKSHFCGEKKLQLNTSEEFPVLAVWNCTAMDVPNHVNVSSGKHAHFSVEFKPSNGIAVYKHFYYTTPLPIHGVSCVNFIYFGYGASLLTLFKFSDLRGS